MGRDDTLIGCIRQSNDDCYVRRIDDLGRVVIPKTLRDRFGIRVDDELTITVVGDCLLIEKREVVDYTDGQNKDLSERLDKAEARISELQDALAGVLMRIVFAKKVAE